MKIEINLPMPFDGFEYTGEYRPTKSGDFIMRMEKIINILEDNVSGYGDFYHILKRTATPEIIANQVWKNHNQEKVLVLIADDDQICYRHISDGKMDILIKPFFLKMLELVEEEKPKAVTKNAMKEKYMESAKKVHKPVVGDMYKDGVVDRRIVDFIGSDVVFDISQSGKHKCAARTATNDIQYWGEFIENVNEVKP